MRWTAALAIALLPCAAAAADPGAERARVESFARSCFESVAGQRWQQLLGCFEAADLAVLRDRYLQRFAAAYAPVPTELRAAFGPQVDKATLLALPPAELLAGAIQGALTTQTLAGGADQSLQIAVAGVEHALENVYTVHTRATLRVWRDGRHRRFERDYALTARALPRRVTLQVPAFLFELLDTPATAQDRGNDLRADDRG